MVMSQWMTGCLRWSLHQNGPKHKGHVAQHFRQLSGTMQQQNSLTRESKIRLVLAVEFILCNASSWCFSESFLTLEVVPSAWGVLFSVVEVPFGALLLVTSMVTMTMSDPLEHWSFTQFVKGCFPWMTLWHVWPVDNELLWGTAVAASVDLLEIELAVWNHELVDRRRYLLRVSSIFSDHPSVVWSLHCLLCSRQCPSWTCWCILSCVPSVAGWEDEFLLDCGSYWVHQNDARFPSCHSSTIK